MWPVTGLKISKVVKRNTRELLDIYQKAIEFELENVSVVCTKYITYCAIQPLIHSMQNYQYHQQMLSKGK